MEQSYSLRSETLIKRHLPKTAEKAMAKEITEQRVACVEISLFLFFFMDGFAENTFTSCHWRDFYCLSWFNLIFILFHNIFKNTNCVL